MPEPFIFVVCQNGAEAVCKRELAIHHQELKLAFSQPGFITFKATAAKLPERFFLKSTFARTYGWSLGKTTSENANQLIEQIFESPKFNQADQIHMWQRDFTVPGTKGFEPGPTALVAELASQIESAAQSRKLTLKVNRSARVDQLVLDITIVQPNEWWFGYHVAGTPAARWPGGTPRFAHQDAISRAYFKLREALLWSGIHIKPDDTCAEIGSAPGGACQLLLQKGARVIAIDPSELDPSIAAHNNLIHLRCRSREVKKRDLKQVRWLIADLNATPTYTLDAVAEIATSQHLSRLVGLIMTLKLTDWKLADEIPSWIQRVKSLGFQWVRTRQLAFNRREICLVAVRDKYALRKSRQ